MMIRYNPGSSFTAADVQETYKSGNIRRLRLTLHSDKSSSVVEGENKKGTTETGEKKNTPTRRIKKNGFIYLNKNGTEPHEPILCPSSTSNGVSKKSLPSGVVFGVVRRPEAEDQKEMVVYEWSVNQLKEEMNYIKEVRTSLEQVREKMYGEYNGMKERMQQLINEMKVANVQQDVLQHTLQSQSAALENCSQLNSSLATETIDLQKTLLNTTLENSNMRDEIRSLKQSMEKLKEKDKQLEAAQTENAVLKLKVESSQQANAEAMRDLTRKLYDQYEAKLKEQEQKHYAEKAAIQAKTKEYLRKVEEITEKMKTTEARVNEKDQKIGELENFIHRMEEASNKERHLLEAKLLEHEQEIQTLKLKSQSNSTGNHERSQRLEEEATSLKERIRHLDNMVHCQQKKVKQMIEEVETLKQKIQEKDLFIEQLLEKISFLEAENKELQDKLDYLKSASELVQNHVETTEVERDLPASQILWNFSVRIDLFHDLGLIYCTVDFFFNEIMPLIDKERQSSLGDLTSKSKGELLEMLKRQEKLLANKKFIQSLPDKGKKITEFMEKVKLALAHHEDLEKTTELLSAVRREFHARQIEINTLKNRNERDEDKAQTAGTSHSMHPATSTNTLGICTEKETTKQKLKTSVRTTKEKCEKYDMQDETKHVVTVGKQEVNRKKNANIECTFNDTEKKPHSPVDSLSFLKPDKAKGLSNEMKDVMRINSVSEESERLVESFERIMLTEKGELHNKRQLSAVSDTEIKLEDNPFSTLHNQTLKVTPFIEVLERRAKNPAIKKPPFKPNQILSGSPGSSFGSSPSMSPGRPESRLSPAERRMRDKKHLDDITAARLPPLHHMPTLLLSLEESVALHMEQKQNYEDAQAKLAAQKLGEKLNIKMVSFSPEGEAIKTYREIQDEEECHSSDEDLL
ncbi:myosin-1 [Latimeria chalumnae]|uniref:myosin-1 n=1 Tax=Latimeria chalumnae TaxID=7897 RepID=UPI00313E99AD